jgi:hypothetical protein
LEMQPRRTRRRKGRGMVGQPSWEQERPVSAPAVRFLGCQLRDGLGAPSPISGLPAKWARAERESERPIVPGIARTTEPRRREGAVLDRCARRR